MDSSSWIGFWRWELRFFLNDVYLIFLLNFFRKDSFRCFYCLLQRWKLLILLFYLFVINNNRFLSSYKLWEIIFQKFLWVIFLYFMKLFRRFILLFFLAKNLGTRRWKLLEAIGRSISVHFYGIFIVIDLFKNLAILHIFKSFN
jgi:hypothetical protein